MKERFLLTAAISLSCFLSGCTSSSQTVIKKSSSEFSSSVELYQTSTDEKGYEVITHEDIIQGEKTIFHRVPSSYDVPSKKPGTVEEVDYKTTVYGEEKVFSKHVNVYLPYGYDKENTDKKYNVIYFEHGNKQNVDNLISTTNMNLKDKIMMDNLFDSDLGGITPSIVVMISFYLTDAHDTDSLAGDSNKDVPANFYLELRKDIMPLVEGKYNTYANKDTSDENLKAVRDHRAISGYSRGGMFTWAQFNQNFDYFRYYLPMSAFALADSFNPSSVTLNKESAFKQMKDTIANNPGKKFFIYAASGNITDMPGIRDFMAYLAEQKDTFSYGTDTSLNNLCYTVADYDHGDPVFPYYYYNTLQVAFK
jgi:enterochelin esterase-like enzyme